MSIYYLCFSANQQMADSYHTSWLGKLVVFLTYWFIEVVDKK